MLPPGRAKYRESAFQLRRPGGPAVRALAVAASLCGLLLSGGCSKKDVAPIPVGATERDLVITSSALARDLTMSAAGLQNKAKQDSGATGWSHRLEEQLDPPADRVVRHRFRLTVSNRSDEAREFSGEIAFISPADQKPLKVRELKKFVVPPFTETSISGFVALLEDRVARAEARVREIPREN